MTISASFTEYLAGLVCDIADSPLSGPVIQEAELCLVDYLASSLAGARSDVAAAGQAALPVFGIGHSVLLARPEMTSLLGSAFYHGLVSTVEDLDDSHRFASGLHMSATTFPVALAIAEITGNTGIQFLKSVVAGYEVSSRLCRAADAGLRERGFHSTGAVGPFGACAAACVLLGLDQKQTARAFGLVASGAGGLFAFLTEGATVRHVHAAWASVNGVVAAQLAGQGVYGPRLALEGMDGFFQAYATRFDPAMILAPFPSLTGKYEILNAYHKVFSACGHAIPALTAVLALRDEFLPIQDQIRHIDVRAYKASAALHNANPASAGEAKFSLPVLISLALIHGDITQRELADEVRNQPAVRHLAGLIRIKEDPDIAAAFPRLRSTEMIITLADGTKHRQYVDAPIGMPENPVGRSVLEAKFRTNASELLSAARQDEILSFINGIEAKKNLVELFPKLSVAAK